MPQLYESIRHEHHTYTDEEGNTIPTVWYFVRLEGETQERRVMTVINPAPQHGIAAE